MKKTIFRKRLISVLLALCFIFSPLIPWTDYRAEAATVSDTEQEIFDELHLYISSLKETTRVGNERVGYYWAACVKDGKNYITSYYYSKTKSGKGKVFFTKKFNYSDYFDKSYGTECQYADIYTNGKKYYFIYDLSGTGYADVYYGSVGKKVKKISKLSGDFNEDDVLMVYNDKLYYSCYSRFNIDSGEKWDNDREVVSVKNYVYDPKVGKPKRIMLKYDWIGTTGRYLYCHCFSKIESGEWAKEWGTLKPYQEPDYPVYDESKVLVYDCKTCKFVKTLTGESFRLGDREFENNLYYWYEDYDNNIEYHGYYGDSCDTILFEESGNKLILKTNDKVVIADELGNVLSTLPDIEGYWYPLENEEDKFAAINGTRWRDEYMCPETIRIYDFKGNILCETEIEEGETLLKLTKNYAYTMPLEPERINNGNFKIKVLKYNLKTGQRTEVCNVNALGSSDVKKAFTKKGKICYVSVESLLSTENYVYWQTEYSMQEKYDPDILGIIGDPTGVPKMEYYRLDRRTNKIKKLTEKTYDRALEKFKGEFSVLDFYDYIEYNTGRRDWWRG